MHGWTQPALLVVLAAVSAGGCGGDDAPKPATAARTTATAPISRSGGSDTSTAVSTSCADATCAVHATCNGADHVRSGPGPVKTRSSSTDGTTTIVLDFAGSARDSVIRC
jgi:hypothetical protein